LLKNDFPRPSSSGITGASQSWGENWPFSADVNLPGALRQEDSPESSKNGENKSLFGNNTTGDYSFTDS
jgi:hypothetical protein